jgi:hypothetical protein
MTIGCKLSETKVSAIFSFYSVKAILADYKNQLGLEAAQSKHQRLLRSYERNVNENHLITS